MEITGDFRTTDMGGWEGAHGAFSAATAPEPSTPGGGYSGSDQVVDFYASRSWTGWTSTNGNHSHSLSINSAGAHTHSVAIAAAGAHTHAITIGKTGSGAAFSILPPYIAVYMWRRTA